MAVDDPCIITCAVSGAVADKAQCPGIPYTPEEYAKEVRRARDAGASMVHVHAREPKGFVFSFVFENRFEDIVFLLERMNEAGVKPECECFDVGHVESVGPLVDLGVLTPPIQFSLIHGVLGGISANARNLAHMSSVVPPGCTWGVIAVSREQWTMVGASAALGGNVRVGFE